MQEGDGNVDEGGGVDGDDGSYYGSPSGSPAPPKRGGDRGLSPSSLASPLGPWWSWFPKGESPTKIGSLSSSQFLILFLRQITISSIM